MLIFHEVAPNHFPVTANAVLLLTKIVSLLFKTIASFAPAVPCYCSSIVHWLRSPYSMKLFSYLIQWYARRVFPVSQSSVLWFDAMVPLTVPSIVTISNVIIPLLFSGNLPLVLCLFSMHFQLSAQVITFVHPSYSWSYKNITQKHLENSSHKKHSWWRS